MAAKKSNIEQVVVSKIIEDNDIVPFLDGGISSFFFLEKERWRETFIWITNYRSEHGEIPKPTAFSRAFPNHDLLTGVEEPTSALVEEMIKRRRRMISMEGLQEAADLHVDGDVEAALVVVQRMVRDIAAETKRSDITRSSEFVDTIVHEALNRTHHEILGIPTGFPTIDDATGGMQSEQFLCLIAQPKGGKSSVALKIAMNAVDEGEEGMLFTFEMSNFEVQQRAMSLGANISLTRLLRGSLFDDEKERLLEWSDKWRDWQDLILVHDMAGNTTVGAIAAKIDQYKPKFVVIDGMYLMIDELGETTGSPQALTNITRSTKRLAQRVEIPILGTTQALLSRISKRRGTQIDSVGYTSSFAQDADAIFGLDRDDLSQPTAKLKVIAARNALGVEVDLTFDYSQGIIEEIAGTGGAFRTVASGGFDD